MNTLKTTVVSILFLILGPFWALMGQSFDGSVGVSLEQRFFQDERFKYVNGFSEYFSPGFSLDFGINEVWHAIEPVLSVSYIKNSSIACVVEVASENCVIENGQRIESEDRFRYQILDLSIGLQKYFFKNRYWVQPFIHLAPSVRLAWIKKETFAVAESTRVNGFEFGGKFRTGFFVSFLDLQRGSRDSLSIWNVKDFGASIYATYLPSGLFQQGMGMVSSLSGHSFGMSLLVDW